VAWVSVAGKVICAETGDVTDEAGTPAGAAEPPDVGVNGVLPRGHHGFSTALPLDPRLLEAAQLDTKPGSCGREMAMAVPGSAPHIESDACGGGRLMFIRISGLLLAVNVTGLAVRKL